MNSFTEYSDSFWGRHYDPENRYWLYVRGYKNIDVLYYHYSFASGDYVYHSEGYDTRYGRSWDYTSEIDGGVQLFAKEYVNLDVSVKK